MDKLSGIYVLISSINGKAYVGSSVDIDKRFKDHIRELDKGKHHNYKLQQHWKTLSRKGGYLELYVLEECKIEDMPRLELEYIRLYDSVRKGFNCTYDTRRVIKRKPKKKPKVKVDPDLWYATREFR